MELKQRVEESINRIRPFLVADGGDLELVEVTEDGIVKVRLQGACHACPMANITLKNGIENALREDVPEIKSVEAVQ